MARATSAKDVRDDQHFMRIIESAAFRDAAGGEVPHRWLVRHAKTLIAFREEACAGAYRLNLDDRDAMIVRLREFRYSMLSIPAAAEKIASDLQRYLGGNFRRDEGNGGPPSDDPARAMMYAVCKSGRVPASADQIENILRGKRTKRRKAGGHAG